MDKCSKCGAELNIGSVFCHMCGTKLISDETICKNADDSITNEKDITEQTSESNINNNGYADESTVENEKKSENLLNTDNASTNSDASKKSFLKNHKGVLIIISVILLIVIIVIIAIAASSNNSKSNNYSSYNGYSYSTGYTDSQLESLATTALYSKLNQTMLHGGSLSTWYDLGSTRYSIGSIVENGKGWTVRGTFSLYDYYGKISSYYNCTFTVNISESGSTTCTVDIK